MAQPEAFGICVTVEDVDAASRFYTRLYEHDQVQDRVYEGMRGISIMRNGETLVNIFERTKGIDFADSFPILKVESVKDYAAKVKELGGSILVPPSDCPCTNTQYSICIDATGRQFMIKEPRRGNSGACPV